ncbi:MAG: glycosyltransferase family 2 protein [Azospirillaceae bacterium]
MEAFPGATQASPLSDPGDGGHPRDRLLSVFDLEGPPAVPDSDVTAVVLCHNEARRLPYFLTHHKALGIGHFIVVDNDSDDGSGAILDADPDVTRLFTTRPYSEYKSIWREAIADYYLEGRWICFPDVDELLVYPGWPDRSLPEYCEILDEGGYDALFTTMVDMYPDRPLSQCHYEAGQSFIDVAPYFDTGNYRLVPLKPKQFKGWATPRVRIAGGARERLFHRHAAQSGTFLDRLIAKTVFSLRRSMEPGPRRRELDVRAVERLERFQDPVAPPAMCKVPLVRWRQGTRFRGGVHRMDLAYRLAPDWGCLLHFKYFDDFGDKAVTAVSRGQHAGGAEHYQRYLSKVDDVSDRSLLFRGSRRFTGVRSLISAGLMRDRLRPARRRWLPF